MKKNKLKYIFLGLGIGMIITNVLYYINPRIEHEDLSEEEIVSKAEDLGMVPLKENIALNEEKKKKQNNSNELDNKEEEKAKVAKENISENKVEKNDLDNKETPKKSNKKDKNLEDVKLVEFTIGKGDHLYDISEKLKKAKLIDDEYGFNARVYERKASKKMRYGNYQIEDGSDYDKIIDVLIKGSNINR